MPQNTYQETLLRAWNITEQDLALNRRGQASEHQKQLVKRALERERYLVYTVFLVLFVITAERITEFVRTTRGYDPAQAAESLIRIAESLLLSVGVSIPVMAVGLYALIVRRDLRPTAVLPFRTIHGVARVVPARSKRRYREVFIDGHEEFSLSEARSYLFRPDGTYTLYLLGTEVIGVESHNTPAEYQPDNIYLPTKTFIVSGLKLGLLIIVVLGLAGAFVLFVGSHTADPNLLVPPRSASSSASPLINTSPRMNSNQPQPANAYPSIGTSLGAFTVESLQESNSVATLLLRGTANGSGVIQRSSEGLTFVPEDPKFFSFPPGSSGYFILQDDAHFLSQVQSGERWFGILTLTRASFVYTPTPTAFAAVSEARDLQRLPELE